MRTSRHRSSRFLRPRFDESWLAPPIDQSEVPDCGKPYDWNLTSGLHRRFVPGQPGGIHTLTGLAHDELSHVAYDPETNERAVRARSLKLAALQKTLRTPGVFGGESGELLVIGWGSTKGAIEEAVERLREDGYAVSSLHLHFPAADGARTSNEIMQRFKQGHDDRGQLVRSRG